MPPSLPKIERARPLLGTSVAIRVHGMQEGEGHRAINEAFDEVAHVHRLMSFHEPVSDVSRLNREAVGRSLEVDPATFTVLQQAEEISRLSGGCFDITIAPELVRQGALPSPVCTYIPDSQATWRDVVLEADNHVRFRRALWIDLGGIAKGYAVDRALEKLRARGAVQASVNAGGDLAVFGPHVERVLLTPGRLPDDALPVLEIENAAVASSGVSSPASDSSNAPHVDGRSRVPIQSRCFVSVVAERCMIADALTKVVMALQEQSEPHLRNYGASAHVHDSHHGWRHFAA